MKGQKRPIVTPISQSLVEFANANDVSMSSALIAAWLVADPEMVRQEAVRIQAQINAETARSKAAKMTAYHANKRNTPE